MSIQEKNRFWERFWGVHLSILGINPQFLKLFAYKVAVDTHEICAIIVVYRQVVTLFGTPDELFHPFYRQFALKTG
jgi:hypothetical protein